MTHRPDIEKLFKKYYAQMHRQAAMLLHDDDLARDIVHDVFAPYLTEYSCIDLDSELFAPSRSQSLS